ncbi:short-chain dehydrogenase [Psychrobacillus sp. NPDC096426]|uniref:short-chain dehydrogenase n=1 Tax=Psychrobacillus sp. NPDC096426 TaxID=3364491 RepID=UPI0037F21B7C
MKHVCIIGGTGMLAEVTRWYADNNQIVSVIARNVEKMNRMKDPCSNPQNIKAIYLDYRDLTKLHQSLEQNIKNYGPLSEAVIWVHSDGADAISTVFELMEENSKVWQVIGSKTNAENLRKQYQPPKNLEYNFIQLGFLIENDRQRWLTNFEIADGVIRSIQSGRSYNLVGEISS